MSEIILTPEQIENKLERIAYQILEANGDNQTIIIAGVVSNGFAVAKRIIHHLKANSSKDILSCEIIINKKNPRNPIQTTLTSNDYKDKSVVLVDDVLHSGTTLIYAVKHFLSVPLKQCKTAVLVDRNHKKFPIKADYKGVSLSTSINENVAVQVKPNGFTAILD
ncbi:MAG: phosphoribosyltransferase [Flavobacteriaceae bacterium]|nr:phosphoribosyltransferase [Flavobacteriaceae bacterium]|tara:strand:+ start:5892 stop:6386 length:495 start_codon:yes stop_codon:yes gene_type:complete